MVNRTLNQAKGVIKNYKLAVSYILLYHLQNSSAEWDKFMQVMFGVQSLKLKHRSLDNRQEAAGKVAGNITTGEDIS